MTASPYARDLELFVTCRSCGFPIATGLRMGPGELADAPPAPREYRCPRCGRTYVYHGSEHAHRA